MFFCLIKTHNSPLTAHRSSLTAHRSPLRTHYSLLNKLSYLRHWRAIIFYLSKKKKRRFWTERPKNVDTQHSYNQANTKQRQYGRKHTKKTLKCFLSFT